MAPVSDETSPKTKYFVDTEFLENGRTIDLISIGIVASDGREYYAVSDEVTRDQRVWWQRWLNRRGSLENRVRAHRWLMANVVPALPRLHGDARRDAPASWLFDYSSPLVKPRTVIAREVRDFLLGGEGEPQLWADYGAYDHVVLCQLWGAMVDLPDGIPMFTSELRQKIRRYGVSDAELPPQAEGAHNALADARHLRDLYQWLGSRHQ